MVLYVILEGVLARTLSGQDVPKKISDLKLGWDAFKWICDRNWTDIVILSNQTWIYSAQGIRVGERFRSKLEYVSECLREELEYLGKTPRFLYTYSMKKPWCTGISETDLLEDLWGSYPDLQAKQSVFMCRPIPFDTDFALGHGLNQIITQWT